MIIGIDASKATFSKRTGVEEVVYQVILNLKAIDKDNTYLLYTHTELPKELLSENFKEVLIPFPKFWQSFRLPMRLAKEKLDVFISPSGSIPFFAPKKTIVYIHDMASKIFPEYYSQKQLFLNNFYFKLSQKATDLVFVSQNTMTDYDHFYKTSANKSVIHLGFDPVFAKENGQKPIHEKYILFVGRLEARKNIVNILKSFELLKEKGDSDHKLVLAGHPGFGYDEIQSYLQDMKYKNDVIFPGYIKKQELSAYFRHAELFLFPTQYEGFGLPILEAMAAGIPVITSNVSCMPEIAGNAALLIDPNNPEEICRNIENILSNPALRENLIEKGYNNIKRFSWQDHAKKLLEIING